MIMFRKIQVNPLNLPCESISSRKVKLKYKKEPRAGRRKRTCPRFFFGFQKLGYVGKGAAAVAWSQCSSAA